MAQKFCEWYPDRSVEFLVSFRGQVCGVGGLAFPPSTICVDRVVVDVLEVNCLLICEWGESLIGHYY